MKNLIQPLWLLVAICVHSSLAQASLLLKIGEPKTYGQKAIIKMQLQNTFTNSIESARAVVFLINDKGKVVGQQTRWVIGGTKEKPGLSTDAQAVFHFVVQTTKPFVKTKVLVTRLILEGGKVVDANKEVLIE